MHRLHGMELARRHLLERRGVETEVDIPHGRRDAARIAHVAHVELELGVVVTLAHVILLLLVTTEDADFVHVGVEETSQDGVAEGTGTSGNQQYLAREYPA